MNEYLVQNSHSDADMVRHLLDHMARSDYVGLDFPTIWYHPKVEKAKAWGASIPWLSTVWKKMVSFTVFMGGHLIVPIINPERLRYAKALGLCVSAYAYNYANASEIERQKSHEAVNHLLDLLEEKRLDCGLWAHEFNYHILDAKVDIHTPNLVTTAFVVSGFWDWWQATGDKSCFQKFSQSVEKMTQVFPFVPHEDGACFMYTPVSNYFVHNANLLMAELVAKQYFLDNDDRWLEYLEPALQYSLADFRKTRTIPYAGLPTRTATVDNYHTGFVLRSLNAIRIYAPIIAAQYDVEQILVMGIQDYFKRFVRQGRVWNDYYQIKVMETHSLAEAILIEKSLGYLLEAEQQVELHKAITRTIEELWGPGYFKNNVKVLPLGIKIADKADMIRWSQAWMAFALAYHPVSVGVDYQEAVG